jgi:hypothetical protein
VVAAKTPFNSVERSRRAGFAAPRGCIVPPMPDCRILAIGACLGRVRNLVSVMLGLATMVSSCAGRPAVPVASSDRRKPVTAVPAFAGTAAPVRPPSSCRNLLPPAMPHPFMPADHTLTARDYTAVECWVGTLAGKRFRFGAYFSPGGGGGLAIRYAGTLVAHLQVGSGPPTIVRFTGNDVCIAEKAGAYFEAVDLRTGSHMDDDLAQDVCPPPTWPPAHVLGLGHKQYPIKWPGQSN